jgi:hypothetical protein
MEKLTEEQIWEIIDGEASPEITKIHAVLLEKDEAYRLEFESCYVLQKQLLNLDLEVPSMRFTENILDNVLPKTQLKQDKTPFYFVLTMGVLSLVSFTSFLFAGDSPAQNIFSINTEGVISFISNPMVISIFWTVNALLFFIILDKKIFKPFYQKRLKRVSQ